MTHILQIPVDDELYATLWNMRRAIKAGSWTKMLRLIAKGYEKLCEEAWEGKTEWPTAENIRTVMEILKRA
jgi:hypothetical protein